MSLSLQFVVPTSDLHGDIPSLEVIPEGASLRFPAGDAGAIAGAVCRLADSETRSRLRRGGLAAADNFRPHSLITRLEEALRNEGCPMP